MAKKKKSNNTASETTNSAQRIKSKRRHPKKNWKQIFMVGALILAMLAFILSGIPSLTNMKPKNNTSTTSPTTTTSTPKTDASLTFKKEGTFQFFEADGTTSIQNIEIEVANTERERQQGMMFRRHMKEGTGMLFPSAQDEPQSFWMKNTYVALDIIYIRSDKTIVTIQKDAQPLSETSLPSSENAQYVLEVPAGYCDKYGIAVGSKIDFTIF